jgi:hypothetical protein
LFDAITAKAGLLKDFRSAQLGCRIPWLGRISPTN